MFSACTAMSSGSVTEIGRNCSITFSACTEPTAANGKPFDTISFITSGNVRMNG